MYKIWKMVRATVLTSFGGHRAFFSQKNIWSPWIQPNRNEIFWDAETKMKRMTEDERSLELDWRRK
jgi:hypothetical protein